MASTTGKPVRYQGEIFQVGWYNPSWVRSPPPAIYAGANGPQMLKAAPRYADGIMVSDFVPDHVRRSRAIIDATLRDSGADVKAFPMNNFWAWHVKETREEAHQEARRWLAIRATPYPDYYYRDILPEDEMQIIFKNRAGILKAFNTGSHVIEGVPDDIMARFVDKATSASSLDNLDFEIERLKRFKANGLTDIALRIYANPEWTIRLIGERVLPALA